MATTSSAGSDLVATLEQYGLVGPETLAEVRASGGLRDEEILAALTEAGHLTNFQSQMISRGMTAQLVVSRYILLDSLGTGSMGTAYKARSTQDDGLYAIKVVPRRNVINLTSLATKVEALKQVRHPRVSALVHVGTHKDWAFAVYPFLEGGEKLDALVKRLGRLTPRQAAQVTLQVASGLQAYHEHGLFHGLLKPNEIVIGSDRRARVLDFGVGFLLACERGKSLLDTTTNTKALSRGLDCASPESILDPLDRSPAGDQYSLGCILYFCLAGQLPFTDANPVKKMLGHQFEMPTPLRDLVPDMPPALDEIAMRMLAKRPEDRYAGIGELVERLQELTTDERKLATTRSRPTAGSPSNQGIAPAPVPVPEPTPQEPEPAEEEVRGGVPAWLVMAGIAAVVGVVTALVMWWMRQ